ncbi:MAG: phosphate ABC transporter substrate-binding protein PstS [archaeon]|nr:phosphate ABC transporter substrate-binding protein PstS [archaeon]
MDRRLYINEKRAIGTTAVVIIVIVIIIIAAGGAYAAINLGKSSSNTTTTSTTTTATNAYLSTSCSITPAPPTGVSVSSSSTATLTGTLPTETISETGSTLLYPLFQAWVPNFTSSSGPYSNVQINTAGTGSGTGISDAAAGSVQIGASDAYLLPTQMTQYPNLLNIPLAISAQQIFYNIPGISSSIHLNFTGQVLAGIYNGSITNWNDQRIQAINPGAKTLLPNHVIIPVRRADGSGDTFIFTTYLSDSSPQWNSTVGFGTTVSWPSVPGETTGTGNGGMVTTAAADQYSIAYIGISFAKQATGSPNNLGYAYLGNKAGNFVNATQTNISAAASALTSNTPTNEAISLVCASGANSYPIINYEYAIVSKTQSSSQVAQVVQTFLTWCLLPQYGNSYHFLNQVGFIQLPSTTVTLSENQIAQIT